MLYEDTFGSPSASTNLVVIYPKNRNLFDVQTIANQKRHTKIINKKTIDVK